MSEVGGAVISGALHDTILRSGQGLGAQGIIPRALVKRSRAAGGSGKAWDVTTTPTSTLTRSLLETLTIEVLDDIKKSACHVAEVGHRPDLPPEEVSYELPDGTVIKVGAMREEVCELHFRLDSTEKYKNVVSSRQHAGWHALHAHDMLGRRGTAAPLPLHHMIRESLLQLQPTLRRDLCPNSASSPHIHSRPPAPAPRAPSPESIAYEDTPYSPLALEP